MDFFDKYTDGTPISYQVWNNYLMKNQNLQIYLNTQHEEYSQIYIKSLNKSFVQKIEMAKNR